MTRQYSSTSNATTLASSINTTVTSLTVATGTGAALLGGVTLAAGNVDIFTVAIDPDTVNEEIVYVTARSGDTLTIVRGEAGTGTPAVSGISHTSGAAIKHVLTSDDLIFFRNNASPVASFAFSGSTSGTTTVQATAIAGTNTLTLPATTSDTLVGKATTDTLTNKTLTTPTINSAKINLALNAQTGTTYTLVASDSSKLVTTSNASAVTVTIPPAIFTAGEQINVQSIGAGITTFAAGSGVTITSTGATSAAPNLRTQFSACTIICTASNVFTVIGDLS
jgi:hypothetical protein